MLHTPNFPSWCLANGNMFICLPRDMGKNAWAIHIIRIGLKLEATYISKGSRVYKKVIFGMYARMRINNL